MKLICPSCSTAYVIEDATLGDGRQVQCTRCGSIWDTRTIDSAVQTLRESGIVSVAEAEKRTSGEPIKHIARAANVAHVFIDHALTSARATTGAPGHEAIMDKRAVDQTGDDTAYAPQAPANDDYPTANPANNEQDDDGMWVAQEGSEDSEAPLDDPNSDGVANAQEQGTGDVDHFEHILADVSEDDADRIADEDVKEIYQHTAGDSNEAYDSVPHTSDMPHMPHHSEVSDQPYRWGMRRKARPQMSSVVAELRQGNDRIGVNGLVAATAIVITLFVFAVGALHREALVARTPGLASLYRLVGLDVNLRDLELSGVSLYRDTQEDMPILIIKGQVTNLRQEDQDLPALRFTLRGKRNQELYAWTVRLSEKHIGGDETVDFQSRLALPPREAHNVLVNFVDESA